MDEETATTKFRVGTEYGVTAWSRVEQETVDLFGKVTDDDDPMHSDPEWARTGPFGVPVAHGMYIVSLMPRFAREFGFPITSEGDEMAINYGFDRVRMLRPVPVGSSIRCRMTVTKVTPKGERRLLVHTTNIIECDVAEKEPFAIIDWICLYEYAS